MTTFLVCLGLLFVFGALCIYSRRWERGEKLRALAHMEDRPSRSPTDFGLHYFSSDQASVAAQVFAIFANHMDLDVSKVHPDDLLVQDLRMDALDSMSTVEFIVELEKHFGVTIPDNTASEMRTLRDVTDFITHELPPSRCV